MGRKWNNIKEKKAQKIKIRVEFMRALVRRFMWRRNRVSRIRI